MMSAGTDPETDTLEDQHADLRQAGPWLAAIADAEKTFANYHQRCDNIARHYADLRSMAAASGDRQMRLFWANLEVLKPAIYARKPIPVVSPRFGNRKGVPRTTADILERCLIASYDLEDLHSQMLAVRDDLALFGRGVIWLRYDHDPDTGVEAVRYEHVSRQDFLHNPARKWSEVEWVARRSWLDDETGEARFGDAWASVRKNRVSNQASDGGKGDLRGEVWEIWHKHKRVVVWVSPNQDAGGEVLDIQNPPFDLHRFFPCPRPAYGTCEPDTLRPVPDFMYCRDQLEEINQLTARLSALCDALKMKGFYAAGAGEIGDAIEAALKSRSDNAVLVPVSNFAALGGAGLKDSIVWLPVAEIAATIQQLIGVRQQLITDVYQITGISDIMRGDSQASETATAQQIKAQYGNVRVRDRQESMVRVSLEVTEIAAEIMAETFMPETLRIMSQVEDVPDQATIQQQIVAIQQQVQQAIADPQVQQMARQNPDQAQQLLQQAQQQIGQLQEAVTWEKCVQTLRDQKTRPFVLDIETNSTVQPDEMADKQSRVEALQALGSLLGQALPVVQAAPETGQFFAETLKWFASGFRMGRAMDTAIDGFADQLAERARQPKQPDPAAMQAQAEAEARDKQLQLEAQKHQDQMALRQQELALKADGHLHAKAMAEKSLEFQAVSKAAEAMAQEDRAAQDHRQRDAELQHELDSKRVEAGLPPGYSFDDDRAHFQAILEEMRQSRDTTHVMLTMISQQNAELGKALAVMAAAAAAPKRINIQKDAQGRIIGGTTEPQAVN